MDVRVLLQGQNRPREVRGTKAARPLEVTRPAQTRSGRGWAQVMKLGVKRGVDVGGALAGLVALAPVLGVAAISVWATSGRPIFFRQWRPGRDAKPFEVLKFRTMRLADAHTGSEGDAARLTAVGTVLRTLSIDELPQLINVLRGEMSLVGPRPLLLEYVARYSPRQATRHAMRPGLTGLAQVRGRNALSWEAKLEYDAQYVEQWSLWLDAKLIALTFPALVARRGISSPDHATMPEFRARAA